MLLANRGYGVLITRTEVRPYAIEMNRNEARRFVLLTHCFVLLTHCFALSTHRSAAQRSKFTGTSIRLPKRPVYLHADFPRRAHTLRPPPESTVHPIHPGSG